VHRAAWGSLDEKRVPWPSHTSPYLPCSTYADPLTEHSKEKILENSSPPSKSALQASNGLAFI